MRGLSGNVLVLGLVSLLTDVLGAFWGALAAVLLLTVVHSQERP